MSEENAQAVVTTAWEKNTAGPVNEAALRRQSCYTAVDFSVSRELVTLVHLFPPIRKGERWVILARFWVPAEGVEERAKRDRAPYRQWIDQGWIRETAGSRVDYQTVFKKLMEDVNYFDPWVVTFDPWNAGTVGADCAAAGLSTVEFPQRMSTFAYPTGMFLSMVQDGKFEHGGNPVLAWMARNLVLVTDHNGDAMPSKKRSTGRINGMVALIMALAVSSPAVFGRREGSFR